MPKSIVFSSSRTERWSDGSSNGELPPQFQKVGTHVTSFVLQSPNALRKDIAIATNHNIHLGRRTPALDLAQQAQLAACNYLGYSPRDLPNEILRPQGPPTDRPMEVHMHHYHHHYVAPTSPFSQTRAQCCQGPAREIPGPATSKLAIRAKSPVTALPTSTNFYPALALRGTSVLPQLIHSFHDPVENPSQSLQNGAYVGDVDAAQRYMQNVLWLKNQIDDGPDRGVKHWQERREDNGLGSETRIIGRKLRSPDSDYMRTSEQLPIRHAKKVLWPRDGDDSPDSTSSDVRSKKFKSRATRDSALLLEKCEKMRAMRNNSSPRNSLSEDNSITDDSARSVSLISVKCQRSPSVRLTIRKTRTIETRELPSTIEPLSRQGCESQTIVRPESCLVCPSWPLPGRQDLKSYRARSPSEDTASSLEIDSVDNSVRASVHGSPRTNSNSSAESDTQPRELSPRGRPTKQGSGARASCWQASRDARAWDKVERKPRKISCRASTTLEARVQPEWLYQMDSESKAEDKDVEGRYSNLPDDNSCLQGMRMEEKEREDTNKPREQRSESRARRIAPVETSRQTSATDEHEESSIESNRGHQHISVEHVRSGTYEPRFETLHPHSNFPSRTAENTTGDYSSETRLREAVEAAWNTNLGTKRGFGDCCMDVSSGHKYNDEAFPSEVHGDLKGNTLLPSAEGKAHSCLWKVRLGTNGVEENCRKQSSADPIFENIQRDQDNLRALVAREESLQRELKDQTVARVAAEERARLTAEEKAHIYEASAKAAEEGLRVLLDERALFHSKFKEELEKGATDRLRLQELLHLEKLKLESTESELREVRRNFQDSSAVGTRALPSKNTLQDHRLNGLSVNAVAPHGLGAGDDEARLKLMNESEKRIAAEAKASHFEASAKAAEERLRSLLDERNWFYSRFKEELEQNNTDMKKLEQLMELEKSNHGLTDKQQEKKVDVRRPVGLGLAKKNLDIKTEAQHCFGEDRKSPLSIDMYENRDIRYMKATGNEKSNMKNEKKRPLSPVNDSRVLYWKSGDEPLSEKVDRFDGRDRETPTVLDDSPLGSRLDSIGLTFTESPESPKDCRFAADDSLDIKENTFDFVQPTGLASESCAQMSHVNGGQLMTLPSKWKKDSKAELRRMIHEQEKTWKIAEDAVEELGRRLELLERYKMEIQDTLGRTRVMGNIDLFFKQLKENLGDCPRGFNSLYNSPIYEGKALYKCPLFIEKKGGRPTCQDVCTSPTRPDFSKDSEIEKLKIEVAQLRVRLQQQDSRRPDSPKLKVSPRSQTSPKLPTSRPVVADMDWSANFLSGFETPVEKEDISPLHLISQRNPTTPEVILEEMEPKLENDSFEEMKTITLHATPNGSNQYSNGTPERFDQTDNLSSRTEELTVDDRGWVRTPIPDESQDNIPVPMFLENGTGQMERIHYQERSAPQEDILLSVDLNSEEDKLRVLKTAVHKLSRLFWEQEEKLKIFKHRYNKESASNFQAEAVKNLYLDMLKEMSQHFGELSLQLHAKTQCDEVLLQQERTIPQSYPSQSVQKLQNMKTTDKPATTQNVEIAQQLQIDYEDASLSSSNKLTCEAKESTKGEEERPENVMAELENLTLALRAAEKKIEEQISTNLLLTEKLESGNQYLSKMQAEHAQEVARKNDDINNAQQANFDLSNDMSQTETSLAEIKSRCTGLVSTLEQQLEDAKTEALRLQDSVSILKQEIDTKENLISSLKAEAKEHELQTEQLRTQIETIQNDTSESGREKLELLSGLEATRREMDEQQRRVTELISINEDLIDFSKSKEDEITGLKWTIKDLQQCVDEKSAEAAKLSAETLRFSQEVVETRKEGETYRLRCTALKSTLEEIQHELQARETSMERLSKHLGKTIEGQDFILEEKEQLLLSLNRSQYKEHRLDDQVRQSKIVIQDLEEKLISMDAEINEAKLEMAEMKAKGFEASLIEQHAEEMRNRVHELEEEIMEKEGQISILKTSYPGEYTSTF